ncbi:hypothetical protein IFM89_013615 [Coptis chinensis]|uniref:KIB1-4 beta-propeller domain-containing protein n=1 Tax=Coptis chinensis TaxID=261450 RepID=A0A835MB68_9MAGN|nr:hypothetical protein IFM89_013615 [Coptis chinensis]
MPMVSLRLYFCRPGKDESWNSIQGDYHYSDITFYKGNLYALRCTGEVDVVNGLHDYDVSSTAPAASLVGSVGQNEWGDSDRNYLVVSNNDLLKVATYYDFESEVYSHFIRSF